MPPIRLPRHLLRRVLLPTGVLLLVMGLVRPANALEAHHALAVVLTPSQAHLAGVDHITIRNPSVPLKLYLGAAVVIERLEVDGRPADYRRQGPWISLTPGLSANQDTMRLTIEYQGRFDDPTPTDPVNTDNPGFGVTGSIAPRGSLLLAGAGWYPAIEAARERFSIEVTAPPGTLAVTAGRAVAVDSPPGATVSAWQVESPARGLALVAGPFIRREKRAGRLQAATYFRENDPVLTDQYLEASLQYMADFEKRFGPYPFAKFAVVENFFPTGYGFPSFTLIGGRVLRLPFIIPTSLRHEIAHCWWGNGVLVDYRDGNWSEGLTTYVSDYLYREQMGPAAARDYRQQLLRNYTELVPASGDVPLTAFTGRHDPLTKAIGYDKAAMVFHMLRQRVGETQFWETLRRIAAERMFKTTSWRDLQQAFEVTGGKSLETFFQQWVRRAGAPQLTLASVTRRTQATGTVVQGVIRQTGRPYALEVPLRLAAGARHQTRTIQVRRHETPFSIEVPFVPERLDADPQVDLFRRLAPQEMPPTINRLKSARDLLVVLPEGAQANRARETAARLGQALGIPRVQMTAVADWSPAEDPARNILLMQPDAIPQLAGAWKRGLAVAGDTFTFDARTVTREGHTYVGVFPHPRRSDRFVAVYFFGRDAARMRIATKVPHYGRYSYLVFDDTRNIAKGVWPAEHSPLIHVWSSAPGN